MIYKVLIVGLGKIGLGYDLISDSNNTIKTHARAFECHNQYSLIGGIDYLESARKTFEEIYHVPTFTNLNTALIKLNPDIVVVASPTDSHLHDIEEIVNNSSVKAILCEKPLSYDVEDAKKIVNLCDSHKIKLYVNYYRRADPAVIELKNSFVTGEIASPIKGVAWYSKGLLHNGSHFIDLLKFWFGPILSSQIIKKGSDISKADFALDFRIDFKNANIIFLAAEEKFYTHCTIELVSSDGRLSYEQGGNRVLWQSISKSKDIRKLSDSEESIKSDFDHYQFNIVNELENAMLDLPHNLTTGHEGLETIKDIFSIIRN